MKSSARNTLIASTTVVALLGAYVTADVYDKVPGVLTNAPAPEAAQKGEGDEGEVDLLDDMAGARPSEAATAPDEGRPAWVTALLWLLGIAGAFLATRRVSKINPLDALGGNA